MVKGSRGFVALGWVKRRQTRFKKHVTDDELQSIWTWFWKQATENPARHYKNYLAVRVLGLGLRIGEVVRLKRFNFSYDWTTLRYSAEKTGAVNEISVPGHLVLELAHYWDNYRVPTNREPYLFSIKGHGAKAAHISTSSIENLWGKARHELGFDDIYYLRRTRDAIKEGVNGWKRRVLHRITPHACRHRAFTRVEQQNGGSPEEASRYLKIRVDTGMRYYHEPKTHVIADVLPIPTHLLLVNPPTSARTHLRLPCGL